MEHELLNKETINYDPSTVEGMFIEKIRAVSEIVESENEIIALIWSPENPFLDTVIAGKAYASRETYQNPLWKILGDLHDRARIRLGLLNLEAVKDLYIVSVSDAAKQLGVYDSTVRSAIKSGGLDGVKKGGRYYLRQDSVDGYQVSQRGARSRILKVRAGNVEGMSFRVMPVMEVEERFKNQNIVVGELRDFDGAAVIVGKNKKYRFYELAVDSKTRRIDHGDFYVEGRFKILKTIHKSREASEAWKTYKAAL